MAESYRQKATQLRAVSADGTEEDRALRLLTARNFDMTASNLEELERALNSAATSSKYPVERPNSLTKVDNATLKEMLAKNF